MSDDKFTPPRFDPGDASPAPSAPKVMSMPDVFVRGARTTSWANDQEIARGRAESEERRAVADKERRIASVPIEQGGGILATNRLTSSPDVPQTYVKLTYLLPNGDVWYEFGEAVECLADVLMVSATELALMIVCPSCKARGLPQDRCQIQIRQSNRKWDLDTSKAGEPIMWVEGLDAQGAKLIKVYRSAGVVRESERFRCDCGWAARIYNNQVRQER